MGHLNFKFSETKVKIGEVRKGVSKEIGKEEKEVGAREMPFQSLGKEGTSNGRGETVSSTPL